MAATSRFMRRPPAIRRIVAKRRSTGGLACGSEMRNVLPAPGTLVMSTRPPCAWTSSRTIGRPRPNPGRCSALERAIEAVEDAVAIGRRDADAAIGDLDDGRVAVAPHADRDLLDRVRVLDGVVEQVGQQPVRSPPGSTCTYGPGPSMSTSNVNWPRQSVRERIHRFARSARRNRRARARSGDPAASRENSSTRWTRFESRPASAWMVSRYSLSFSGDRTRSICSVSVAALSSDNGVFSWCETWATKSVCISASSADRRCACTVRTSATSISATDMSVGQ